MAGLTQVPAIVIEADDRKAMELAMIENLQREDLNPIEEAEGYQVLMSQYNMTQEETAQRVGKSRSAVANALRLLNLCPPVRAMVEDGRLTNGHARALLPLSPALQETTAATILKNDLSVRQTEQLVKKLTAGKKEKPRPAGLIVDYAQEAAGTGTLGGAPHPGESRPTEGGGTRPPPHLRTPPGGGAPSAPPKEGGAH